MNLVGAIAGLALGLGLVALFEYFDTSLRTDDDVVTAVELPLEEGWRSTRSGKTFWANVVITALRDSTGRLHGFAQVTCNITARKQTEEALRTGNLDGIKNNDLQPAGLCSVGAAVQVHNIKLWRDTYYTGSAMEASDAGNAVTGDDWKNPKRWDALRNLKARTFYVYPGHYLCLGDNSPESSDSRHWGLVPERLMLGRALVVYFPFDRAGTIK